MNKPGTPPPRPRPAIVAKLAAKAAAPAPAAAPKVAKKPAPTQQQSLPIAAPEPAPAPEPVKKARGKASKAAPAPEPQEAAAVELPMSLRPTSPAAAAAAARMAQAPVETDPVVFGEEFLVHASGIGTFCATLVGITSQRLLLEREGTEETLVFSRALGFRVGTEEEPFKVDYSAYISGDDLRRINTTTAFPNVPYNPGAP